MKKTFITSVVAILCTVAICITYSVKGNNESKSLAATATDDSSYMTEEQAEKYIGVNDDVMQMMRVNLKYFEGAYISYTYTNDSGKEVTDIVYNKEALDKAMEKIMKDTSALNFKYIQESLDGQKK